MSDIKKNVKKSGVSRAYLLKRWLLDFFYPNRCPFCDKIIPYDEYYCSGCGGFFSSPPEKEGHSFLDGLTAYTSYDTVSRAFVSEMKDNSNGYALSAAAYMIFKMLTEEDYIADVDCITCIPMRRKDIQKRGYNQTKLLAKEISGLLGLPFVPLLKKTKDTLEQKKLSAEERKKNIKGAFSLASKRYDPTGKNILIIDDVCTTGSTLSENARTLKSAGAGRVTAAVFAKTTLGS